MSKIKLFEEYYSEESPPSGYVSVPADFEDRLQGLGEFTKRRSEFYNSNTLNQIKIDLFIGIKSEINHFLDYTEDKTQEQYEIYLNGEIFNDKSQSGILAKYSGVKYYNIDKSDVEEVKIILWKHINEKIPFNEVDYYYTYDLQGKLFNLLDDFLAEIQEKGLWKESNKEPFILNN